MASFGTDGKSPVMLSEDAKYDDGVVQVQKIESVLYVLCTYIMLVLDDESSSFLIFSGSSH